MSHDALRVLLIEESDAAAVLIGRALAQAGFQPIAKRVATAPALEAVLADDARWDVIMCGTVIPQLDLMDAVDRVRERYRDSLLVALSDGGAEHPDDAISAGSVDGLLRKDRIEDLPALVTGLMHGPFRSCR